MNKEVKGLTFFITKTVLTVSLMITLVFISCQKHDEPVPDAVVKKLESSVSLHNKNEIAYIALLSNVNSAKLVVNKDGVLVFSQEISDHALPGPDYQVTFQYAKDDPIFKNFTKGKYEFILTSDNFAIDKLEKRTSIEIPNYMPTVNLLLLDLKQLNFMECFDATLPIDANIYKVFTDDNPEDNPISVTGVKSVDGKTTPSIKTTSSGYDLNVKAIPGSFGEYQLELELGTPVGGIEKYILSGTIGKDNRIMINPFISIDDNGTEYNSLTTKIARDNYILEKLKLNNGNKRAPHLIDPIYVCGNYEFQLFVDSKKLGAKMLSPMDWLGKYWFYNNYMGNNLDSIYKNGGTLESMGTIGVPILLVTVHDKSHSTIGFGHGMNAVLTGRDLSTGSLLTKWENWNFIEPQTDAINVKPNQWDMPIDCDEIIISYPYIVEDKINGNHLECVSLVKFRIDNGVPSLVTEYKDLNYKIVTQ